MALGPTEDKPTVTNNNADVAPPPAAPSPVQQPITAGPAPTSRTAFAPSPVETPQVDLDIAGPNEQFFAPVPAPKGLDPKAEKIANITKQLGLKGADAAQAHIDLAKLSDARLNAVATAVEQKVDPTTGTVPAAQLGTINNDLKNTINDPKVMAPVTNMLATAASNGKNDTFEAKPNEAKLDLPKPAAPSFEAQQTAQIVQQLNLQGPQAVQATLEINKLNPQQRLAMAETVKDNVNPATGVVDQAKMAAVQNDAVIAVAAATPQVANKPEPASANNAVNNVFNIAANPAPSADNKLAPNVANDGPKLANAAPKPNAKFDPKQEQLDRMAANLGVTPENKTAFEASAGRMTVTQLTAFNNSYEKVATPGLQQDAQLQATAVMAATNEVMKTAPTPGARIGVANNISSALSHTSIAQPQELNLQPKDPSAETGVALGQAKPDTQHIANISITNGAVPAPAANDGLNVSMAATAANNGVAPPNGQQQMTATAAAPQQQPMAQAGGGGDGGGIAAPTAQPDGAGGSQPGPADRTLVAETSSKPVYDHIITTPSSIHGSGGYEIEHRQHNGPTTRTVVSAPIVHQQGPKVDPNGLNHITSATRNADGVAAAPLPAERMGGQFPSTNRAELKLAGVPNAPDPVAAPKPDAEVHAGTKGDKVIRPSGRVTSVTFS